MGDLSNKESLVERESISTDHLNFLPQRTVPFYEFLSIFQKDRPKRKDTVKPIVHNKMKTMFLTIKVQLYMIIHLSYVHGQRILLNQKDNKDTERSS